jgi:hypothetical protein
MPQIKLQYYAMQLSILIWFRIWIQNSSKSDKSRLVCSSVAFKSKILIYISAPQTRINLSFATLKLQFQANSFYIEFKDKFLWPVNGQIYIFLDFIFSPAYNSKLNGEFLLSPVCIPFISKGFYQFLFTNKSYIHAKNNN